MQHVLHNVEENILQQSKGQKQGNWGKKQQLKEICTEMESKIQVMLPKNIHLQGLYNYALYRNTQMQEEE